MGVAVLHHRVSFHPSSFTTPPPKPSRAANRADRSSPPSAPRSAPKATTTALSPAKPVSRARPGRKVRVPVEDSPPTRRSGGGGGGMVAKLPGRNLVMGEVTILKRREDPKAAAATSTPAAVPQASIPALAAKKPSPPPPVADRSSEEAAAASKADDVVFSSTERLGPEPEILPKQIRLTHHTMSSQVQKTAVYAGSGFIASPSPSCLPFPTSFFAKKDLVDKAEAATNTLKYLLRLDLA